MSSRRRRRPTQKPVIIPRRIEPAVATDGSQATNVYGVPLWELTFISFWKQPDGTIIQQVHEELLEPAWNKPSNEQLIRVAMALTPQPERA